MNTFFTAFVDELAKVAENKEGHEKKAAGKNKKKKEEKKDKVEGPIRFLSYDDLRRFAESKAKELGTEESKRRFIQRRMIARGF